MNPPRSHTPGPGSRTARLLAVLAVAVGLLIGAAGAQARPGDAPVDFLMEVSASSATFTPGAGEPGDYRLVLRGVPSTVGVFELTRAEVTASLPTRAFLAYWDAYGDETGQFTANPPRAVLRGADASGGDEEVVVRLRNGSQRGRTLRFDAEVITSPAAWNQLEAKIDRVDETTPPDEPAPDLEPTALANVTMFVDMPRTITQPRAKRPAPGTTTTPSARRAEDQANRQSSSQRWMPNGGTCNGVYSSRLRNCWQDIPNFSVTRGGVASCAGVDFRRFVDGRGFAYDGVGEVDLGGYYFKAGNILINNDWDPSKYEETRCFRYYSEGWYGVGPGAVTFYTTSRCTWFMAKWSTNGQCW